jgi:hypothetical protein
MSFVKVEVNIDYMLYAFLAVEARDAKVSIDRIVRDRLANQYGATSYDQLAEYERWREEHPEEAAALHELAMQKTGPRTRVVYSPFQYFKARIAGEPVALVEPKSTQNVQGSKLPVR